jgi:ribosomal protein S18 acetylase RimI-like enzyme
LKPFRYLNFQSNFLPSLAEFQQRCAAQQKDSAPIEAGYFLSPGFNNGNNIQLAEDDCGNLVGYASILPLYLSARLDGAQVLRLDLQTLPGTDFVDALKDGFLEWACARAAQIRDELGVQKTVLTCTHFSSNEETIQYYKSRGFWHYESYFEMRRDLSMWIVDHQPPSGVDVRAWRMQSEQERNQYVQAYQQVFVENALSEAELEEFCRSEMWMAGTTYSAFKGDNLVGSVMAFYDPNLKRNAERVGSIEYVFVLPQDRNRGIGSAMLGQALIYLKQRGLRFAKVEMAAANRDGLGFYETAGFELYREEVSLCLKV